LSGDDPARVAVLQAVNMGEIPRPGQTRYLTGDILLARLSAAGISPRAEGWSLPSGILVTTLSQTVAKELIDRQVSAAFMERITTNRLRG